MTKFDSSHTWGFTDEIICTNGPQSGWIYLQNMTKGWPCKISANPFLRLRQSPGSTDPSNTVLTSIPNGEIVVVNEKRVIGVSSWVKTTYNGQTGWICFSDGLNQFAFGLSDYGSCF